MAGADYTWCPVCDCKAAYDGLGVLDGFVVTHGSCWDAVRYRLAEALPEAIAAVRAEDLAGGERS